MSGGEFCILQKYYIYDQGLGWFQLVVVHNKLTSSDWSMKSLVLYKSLTQLLPVCMCGQAYNFEIFSIA